MTNRSHLDRTSISSLMAGFSGAVLLPSEPGYDTARRIHNGLIDRHPAIIACPIGTADVVQCLQFAIAQNLEISVRGGGHNVAGRAVADGGMLIDLSHMRGSFVDPRQRRIRVGGGATWDDFNKATQLHGLATTGGAVSSTGVAGLTLGGGFGFLMGKCGYTIDSLRAVELVTASGEVVQASQDENPELFWGLRGGGGNFGIATSFEFDLQPIGPTIHGGLIAYPFEHAGELLRIYRDVTAGAGDELTVMAGLTHARDGSGKKLVAMIPCHCGAPAEAQAALRPFTTTVPAVVGGLGPLAYSALNQTFDAGVPKLDLYYWKSCFVAALDDDVIALLQQQFARAPSSTSKLFVEHFHGAALRPAPSATAFPHRQPGYSVLIIAQWQDSARTAANIAWARQTYDLLMPYSREGAYSNYMDDDEDLARVKQAFGANFARLQALKDVYDPGNLFHRNQNIPPSRPVAAKAIPG